MREPRLLLAAGRALLLQAANPLVAQGAIEHSTYEPIHTGGSSGPSGGSRSSASGPRKKPNGSRGGSAGCINPSPGAPGRQRDVQGPGGDPYSASDPGLLRWVHASFVDTMLVAHDALIGGLSNVSRDTFVREWDAVARLMGLPAAGAGRMPPSSAATSSTRCDAARRFPARARSRSPKPSSTLPSDRDCSVPARTRSPSSRPGCCRLSLRRGYGLTWTPAHAAAFAALTALRDWQRRRPPGACASPPSTT